MQGEPIEIGAGAVQLGIAPLAGGSIAFLRFGGVNVLRPAPPGALGAPEHASFPMIPVANRIANNRFSVAGRAHTVLPNVPGEPLNIHGSAWLEPWTLIAQDGQSATITLAHDAPGDPWIYRARQHFEATTRGITIGTMVENCGPVPMPFAIGHHPWLPRADDALISFEAEAVGNEGADHLPTGFSAPSGVLDFRVAKPLPASWIDNCYDGWGGAWQAVWPKRGLMLSLTASGADHRLMMFADPLRDVFCLEPQTMLSGALSGNDAHLAKNGMRMLAPGETLSTSIAMTISAIDPQPAAGGQAA